MNTKIQSENEKEYEITSKKEKIINTIFTKTELKTIKNMLNEDDYILEYLWKYFDNQVNQIIQNYKDIKNLKNEEIKEIYCEFTDIIKDYNANEEINEIDKDLQCKIIYFLRICILIFFKAELLIKKLMN